MADTDGYVVGPIHAYRAGEDIVAVVGVTFRTGGFEGSKLVPDNEGIIDDPDLIALRFVAGEPGSTQALQYHLYHHSATDPATRVRFNGQVTPIEDIAPPLG